MKSYDAPSATDSSPSPAVEVKSAVKKPQRSVIEIIGSTDKVLEIDLSTGSIVEFRITAIERQLYLGGKGLGLKYLYDRLKPGVDPLGEKNILAFMMGVVLGTGAPCSSRFAALTKSPLTGIFASSSCGGPFGMALKTTGYEGLLISGRSADPICLEIHAEGVEFKSAAKLWGLETMATQEALELGSADGALAIGPAGENRVLFANVASGHRFLGRGGFGAVMGSKNLKAIVARGGAYKYVPAQAAAFRKIRLKAIRKIARNAFTEAYRQYGTAANVKLCSKGNILPVHNFRDGRHAAAERVSGESMCATHQALPHSCKVCAIRCGHQGTFQGGQSYAIPEYETTALLGPNLGIFDSEHVARWNDQCGRLGIDTISTGVTLSYLMEAGEKGLLDTALRFGEPQGISEMIQAIAQRRGLGADAANGARWLSQKYGGREFAIHVKGLELAAYDPRGSWGQGLAYAVANRGGCHLSATLFALEVFTGFLKPDTTRAKARFVRFFESLNAAINSLQTCVFTSYAYILEAPLVKYSPKAILSFAMQNLPRLAIKMIDVQEYNGLYASIMGSKLTQRNLLEIGDRVHTLERYMNTREGISRKDDVLPQRFLTEARLSDPEGSTVPLDKMLDDYYKVRGYDSDGIPTPARLKKLHIT